MSSAFLFIILLSVLLAAILCDNRLCKQNIYAIAKFPKLKDNFFLSFFFQMGKNRVGGSIKLKIKFLLPKLIKLLINVTLVVICYCLKTGK